MKEIQEKLGEMKKNSQFIEETKKRFEETINDLEKYDNKISSNKKVTFSSITHVKEVKQINLDDNSMVKEKLSKIDIMKVKQRMVSFSNHSFDKFDLKKVMLYWQGNKISLFS